MFDWPLLMHLGLHHLRLRPADFWDLTPFELVTIAGLAKGAGQTVTRANLDALIAQFPDTPTTGAKAPQKETP